MIRILPFLFFFNISLIAISQNVELFYQPIIKDLKNDDWNNLRNNLDTLLTQHRNSLMVPFTLKAIGDRAFDNENFEQLYIYSQLMLQYNADKFRTDLPSESKTKWDYYYIHTAKEGIYNWAHLYLATCYLHQQQYDSCLTHIDQAYIGNYISLPSSGYTYNVITSLHKNLIRSYCYEHKGETKKAIKVITTYLFLDDFEKIEHFYSHKDIIRQFIRLTKDKKKYEISNDTLIKKNILYVKERKKYPSQNKELLDKKIITPEGWGFFNPSYNGVYIKVDKNYVPIYVGYHHYPINKNLKEYLNSTLYFKTINKT